MQTAADFTLMAENCATAAQAASNRDEQLELVLMSAVWRNEALRVTLGDQANLLWRSPFAEDEIPLL